MKKNSNKKVKSFVKNNKTLIIYLSLILIVAFFIFLIVYNFKLTSLEIVKIDEFDAKTSIYMEDYVDTDDEGKYIIYAISYLTNVNNTNEANVNDVVEVINNTFNEKYDEKKIYSLGITPSMLEKGIVLDDGNRKFIYNNSKTRQDIANQRITKYLLSDISKRGRNRFILTYNKYVVDDPYKILNYYNNLTEEELDKEKSNKVLSYLRGEGNIYKVKDLIDGDSISNFGKKEDSIKVTLIVKDDKLVIDKIEK